MMNSEFKMMNSAFNIVDVIQALTDITLVKNGRMPMTAIHPNIPPYIVEQKLDEGYSIVLNWVLIPYFYFVYTCRR